MPHFPRCSLFITLITFLGPALVTASFNPSHLGQLLLPYLEAREANEKTSAFLREHQPGGLLLYNWANGLETPTQVKGLTSGLQAQARELGLPNLFLAVDQEGGRVARLRQGFTHRQSLGDLGQSDDEGLTYTTAHNMGEELRRVGVNFNLAPVVDVNNNPRNPVIGDRSFGADPHLVARHGVAACRGFLDAGILCCLKHFPGHGDVEVDSHESLPILNKEATKLEECEWLPFRACLPMAPAVMTAHLKVPQLDPKDCATLSRDIVTGLLRQKMAFEGLVLTDSLTMGAISEVCPDIGEAAVRALEAGADLLLIGSRKLNRPASQDLEADLRQIHRAIHAAIKQGRLSEERLQGSLDRISAAKAQFLSREAEPPD